MSENLLTFQSGSEGGCWKPTVAIRKGAGFLPYPEKEVQPYGKEASSFTRNALEGQTVKVEYDVRTHDKYGRKLVYVWLNDQNFNRLLVEKGYARVMAISPNTRYLDDFNNVERTAKKQKLGLWQYTNY